MLSSLMYRTYCLTATTNFILTSSLYHKNNNIPSLKTVPKKPKYLSFLGLIVTLPIIPHKLIFFSASSDSSSHWIWLHKKVVSEQRIQIYCTTCSGKSVFSQQKIWKAQESFNALFQRIKHLIFITGKHLYTAVTVDVLQVHTPSYPLIMS